VIVVVPLKRSARGDKVLALPKGHPDGDETPEQAAAREVSEETGVSVRLVDKLGDIEYCYERRGRLIDKRVTFFLFDYVSGELRPQQEEIEDVRWIPLRQAEAVLTYEGEREMAARALSRVAADR
jgi:8-oxo-dGTP pyrophosphatase MutT (NUDIX family)